MQRLRRSRSNALTLVETMIVLAIICILSGIATSILVRSKVSAKNSMAISNLHQIGVAVTVYCSDFDSYFPYACSADDKFTVCQGEHPVNLPLITSVLSSYAKDHTIWQDPMDDGVPRLPASEYSEPIECQLPGKSPSLYAVYGSSFLYRKDLALDHVSEPIEFISDVSHAPLSQSEFVIMNSAYGNWHGGPDTQSKKVVALYGDGHSKLAGFWSIHQQGAYRQH